MIIIGCLLFVFVTAIIAVAIRPRVMICLRKRRQLLDRDSQSLEEIYLTDIDTRLGKALSKIECGVFRISGMTTGESQTDDSSGAFAREKRVRFVEPDQPGVSFPGNIEVCQTGHLEPKCNVELAEEKADTDKETALSDLTKKMQNYLLESVGGEPCEIPWNDLDDPSSNRVGATSAKSVSLEIPPSARNIYTKGVEGAGYDDEEIISEDSDDINAATENGCSKAESVVHELEDDGVVFVEVETDSDDAA